MTNLRWTIKGRVWGPLDQLTHSRQRPPLTGTILFQRKQSLSSVAFATLIRSLLTVLSAPEPLEDSVPFSPDLGSQAPIKVRHQSPQRRHPEKEIHPHPTQLLSSNRQAGSSPPGVHGPPNDAGAHHPRARASAISAGLSVLSRDTGVKARSWHYMSRS